MQPWEIFSLGAFCGTIFGMGLMLFFAWVISKSVVTIPVKIKKAEKDDTLVDATAERLSRVSSPMNDEETEENTGRFTRITILDK